MALRALIFDVDGTLAETEDIHRTAFNEAFAEAALDWVWTPALYARLLRVTGGRERIAAYASERGVSAIDIAAIHARKTELYNAYIARGEIALRPGVEPLIVAARSVGFALAIATTTSRPNVISLIAATLGANAPEQFPFKWRPVERKKLRPNKRLERRSDSIGSEKALDWFHAIRTGEDVSAKKPDPEVYRLVLADLGHAAADCIAFEDSANGLHAARAAGLRTIVTPGVYTEGEDFSGAALVLKDLAEHTPLHLLQMADALP